MDRKSFDKSNVASEMKGVGDIAKTYGEPTIANVEKSAADGKVVYASSEEEIRSLRDQLKTAQETLAETTKQAASTAKKFVSDAASSISDSVGAAASDVSDKSVKVATAVADGTTDVAKKLEQYTRSNPMIALAAALAVGLLIGSRASGNRS